MPYARCSYPFSSASTRFAVKGCFIRARISTLLTALWSCLPLDGLVIFIGPRHGYGNLVIVSHGYGISTKMAHPSKIAATIGQEVRRGPTVGYVGSSGRATDPHLHYEVLVNEIPVNPAKYLKRQAPQQIVQLLFSSPS